MKINTDKITLNKYIYTLALFSLVIFIGFILLIGKSIFKEFSNIELNFLKGEFKDFSKEINMIEDNIDDLALELASDDPSELKTRVSKNFLSQLEIDGIIFLSENKSLQDFKAKPKYLEITYELIDALRAGKIENIKGFIRLKRYPVIIAIRKSKLQSHYAVVFKVIDDKLLKTISTYEIVKLTNESHNVNFYENLLALNLKDFNIYLYKINNFKYFADIETYDIYGKKIHFANAYIDRLIIKEVFLVILKFVFFLIFLLLVLTILHVFMLKKLAVNPLLKILQFLDNAINEKNFSKKLDIKFSSKEFDILEEKINLLFSTIEEHIERIKDQQELFQTIAENIPAVVYLYSDTVEYVNSKIEEAIEVKQDEFLGKPIEEFIKTASLPKEEKEKIYKAISRRKKGEKFTHKFFIPFKTKSGKEKYLMVIANTVFINKKPYGVGIVFDITERKKLEDELKKLALTDPLTCLLNRNGFFREVESLINIYKRSKNELFVLLFDLNKFKFVNDEYGHDIGDILLKTIADRLKNTLRKSDIIARLGGDEFAVVIPVVNKEEDIILVLEKIINSISKPVYLNNLVLKPSTSIGVATFPKDGEDINLLLKRADIAMYKAKEKSKQSGKSEYVFFSEEFEEQIKRKVEMERELEKAILEEKELEVYYQPIVDKDLNIVKLEALMRWKSAKFGNVSPIEFIKIAEETGIITRLTDFLLKQVRNTLKFLKKEGINTKIAVNISPIDMKDENFLDRIDIILQEEKKNIIIEITENVFLEESQKIREIFTTLKTNYNIEIALDDFGTGYSSLVYLRKYPIDYLKIDRTFVRNIETQVEDRGIILAISNLAKYLNIKLIAEGVEKTEQFYFLKDEKINYFQGYLFSKPMPIEDILPILKKGKINLDI